MERELEQTINYTFSNPELLAEALTHPSMRRFLKDNVKINYQRLEFLGDSLINCVISEMVYNNYTDNTEGTLARAKAYLASGNVIREVASRINLGKFIKISDAEALERGRNNPNTLEDSFEAMVAAIYLDSNFENMKNFVQTMWQEQIDNLNVSDLDPKTRLQELTHKIDKSTPRYKVLDRGGKAHKPTFTVEGEACGHIVTSQAKTIRGAEILAARKLLKIIKKDNKK